jgi:hypothetical protein
MRLEFRTTYSDFHLKRSPVTKTEPYLLGYLQSMGKESLKKTYL